MRGLFRDRIEAGQLPAGVLTKYANRNEVIVLALDVFVVGKFRNSSLRLPVRPDATDSLEKRKPFFPLR